MAAKRVRLKPTLSRCLGGGWSPNRAPNDNEWSARGEHSFQGLLTIINTETTAQGRAIRAWAIWTKIIPRPRWPDILARRLQSDKKTASLSILNEGIGGNRILHDGAGPSGLVRFDRDVIAQAGVKYLIIMEGTNDIGHATSPTHHYDVITADDLIQAFVQMAERAHIHGIKVIGATLLPYSGSKFASPAGEEIRQAINQWIRTSKRLDGFIDFAKAPQDPASPTSFSADVRSSDHLHPGDAGYKIMGDAVDLKLFEK
jgi:lysophospholipase L1-like esterase